VSASDWARLNDLFHRAVAEPADRRSAFLDEACRGDRVLHAELVSLLAAHERAGEFIEAPAADAGAIFNDVLASGASLVGSRVAHYAVLRVLGEGGMGVVYLAEDTKLGRLVALKALAPRFTGDGTRRERLRREARAAAGLTDAGIAAVYALEQVGDHLYIVSEYVPGHTLREEIRRGPLPVSDVLDTGLAIVRALAAAHERGLVHRDLKPENVIRASNGGVKLLDFGLARFVDSGSAPPAPLTEAGIIVGTPAYMAPEQIRGDPIDFRADLFALGIVLYELAAGANPFASSDPASTIAKILETSPTRLASHPEIGRANPAGLTDLDAIVARCLEKNPAERFESTAALADALDRARRSMSGSLPRRHAPVANPTAGVAAAGAEWWWKFHQAVASLSYCALLAPLWYVRGWIDGLSGTWLFLAALVGVLVASTLRLHLWFTLRSYPEDWRDQRRRTAPWIRAGDALLVMTLVAAALAIISAHQVVGVFFVGAAVAVLLSFAIIEPATERAAFRHLRRSLNHEDVKDMKG
jgi:hypothetical protein